MRRGAKFGTFVLVLAVVAVIAFLPSTASASFINRTFTPAGGTLTYHSSFEDKPKQEPATSILTVYGGEKISFLSSSNGSVPVVVTGPYTKEGEKYSGEPFKKVSLEPGEAWDSVGKSTEGYFEIASVRVESPYARLTLPERAALDEELIITAETNLKAGEKATVTLLSEPGTIITTVATRVENGSIQARLNTSGLQPRSYTVRVEIGGRASAEAELRLVVPGERGGAEEEAIPQQGSGAELSAGAESAEQGAEERATVFANVSPNATEESQEQERTLKMLRARYDVLVALVLGGAIRRLKCNSP